MCRSGELQAPAIMEMSMGPTTVEMNMGLTTVEMVLVACPLAAKVDNNGSVVLRLESFTFQ